MARNSSLTQKSAYRILAAITALLIGLASLQLANHTALAQTVPAVPVAYDSLTNTIYIGANYNSSDPAQKPYVNYPSHPDAPKSPITLPEVDAALTALGHPDLIVNNGGNVWTLKANTVISQTARLDLTSATLGVLRLDSTVPPGGTLGVTKIVARGGHLNINGIRLYSWDANSPEPEGYDTNVSDGRSFLLAERGGRMDIIDSEISHLGYSPGEPSGLSWRKTATSGDPRDPNVIRTGATGSVLRSNVHDNYFGQYSYEAYGLVIRESEFHHNLYYGIDPHDYSSGFEVAFNKVHHNGNHGIIFSRGCVDNKIHHNEVYDNASHGIMLDRGSERNEITDNTVYNNGDGIAIFQSSNNLIRGNILRDNNRGVRINATFDSDDIYDGLSNNNIVQGNTIENSGQYGIYLYERADKNIIEGNTITGSQLDGIYIKTGGNIIRNNAVRVNRHGIAIIGGAGAAYTPGGIEPLYQPGHKNEIYGNTIEDNNGNGILLRGAVETVIGPQLSQPNSAHANSIRTNGASGIRMDTGAVGNVVFGNTIVGNVADGVLVRGADSNKNRITRNSITANGGRGINLQNGGNGDLAAPEVTSPENATTVTGTAVPGSIVEVYRDTNNQGAVYKGSALADASGNWSFTLPANDNPQEGPITVLAIDSVGNTSPFGGDGVLASLAVYSIGAGKDGETTVFISGQGAIVTLPDIQAALRVISPTTDLLVLEDPANKVWMSNVSLFINRGVTLKLTSDTVSWLKLRSQATDIVLEKAGEAAYNYKSFVTLRTYNGNILIDGVKITSWDPQINNYDTDISNGRSYLLAKYDARMDIRNSVLSYLGSADGESYGVSWRDINEAEQPDVLMTRVTGEVINSVFSYNYYGIYTFQASHMIFRGNKFHNNIGYGFDPHDFSHHFIVEDNEAFENGNHGFIISRGCNNFVIRRNKSYNNRYTVGTDNRRAHGFMLDPGSPNSRYPQEPSFDNLLEYNEAWGNDGYGLRVVGSTNNTVQMNTFTGNLQGITLEQGSTGNTIKNNTLTGNGLYGIYLIGGSDHNEITGNIVTKNGKHGIYIKTGNNTIAQNIVSENGSVVDGVASGSGIATLQESTVASAAADLILPGETVSIAQSAPELLGSPAAATAVENNKIIGNTVAKNFDEGIELKSAKGTLVENNTVHDNGSNGIYLASGASSNTIKRNTSFNNRGHGIRANGADVVANTWTENLVYDNLAGGIVTTSNANKGIKGPKLTQTGNVVTGEAAPGSIVELFSDSGGQARYFETRLLVGSDGTFRVERNWMGPNVNATVTDSSGNSSGLTYNVAGFIPSNTVYLPITTR